MAKKIKPSIFSTGPRDDVIEKDVYREDVLESSNNYTRSSPIADAAGEYVSGVSVSPGDIVKDVTKGVGSTEDGVKVDFGHTKRRVENALDIPGLTNDMAAAMKDEIVERVVKTDSGEYVSGDDYSGIPGDVSEQYDKSNSETDLPRYTKEGINDTLVVVGEAKKKIKSSETTSARSIINAVNKISGNSEAFKMLDLGAEMAFINSVSTVAIEWGIPELIDKVIDSRKDAKTKNALMEDLAIRHARRGDYDGTDYWLRKMGRSRSVAIKESIITNLIRRYRKPVNTTRSNAELGNQLLGLFKWLDPNWDKGGVDTKTVSMEYYIIASTDAREVLLYTEAAVLSQAGERLRITSSTQVISDTFPLLIEWNY